MMPKFSIIVPVYNVAPYLRECLDSIVEQTFTDWEAICVDDGSADGSGAILDGYAKKDSRFRVTHQQNKGVSVSRNTALDMARGEWVWFVDADDAIHSDSLEKTTSALIEHPDVDIVFIKYAMGVGVDWEAAADSEGNKADYLKGITRESTSNFFRGMCMQLFRREIIGKTRLLPFKFNEDAIFVMECCWRGTAFLRMNRPMYFYRQHNASATHKKFTVEDVEKIFESERVLLSRAKEGALRFDDCDCSLLFSSLRRRMYNSYYGAYFKLDRIGRKKLLKEWVDLQEAFRGYCPFSKELRFRLLLVKTFCFGWLVERLAFGNPPGWNVAKWVYAKFNKRKV